MSAAVNQDLNNPEDVIMEVDKEDEKQVFDTNLLLRKKIS
jgi:hypothetical protein